MNTCFEFWIFYLYFVSCRLHFREFLLQERLSVNQIALCSRHVYGDLTLLAAALGISDEVTLKSKHEKNTRPGTPDVDTMAVFQNTYQTGAHRNSSQYWIQTGS